MLLYLIQRLLYGFWVLIGAVVAVFFIFHVLPGDPVSLLAGMRSDVATRDQIAQELGLKESLPKQLIYYINDLSPLSIHGDTPENAKKYNYHRLIPMGSSVLVAKTPYMRRSYQSFKLVSEIIWENVEGTFWLALSAMLFATVFGVGFGILASLRQHSWLDHSMIGMSVLGISIPPYVLGLLLAMVFGHYLKDYTGLNVTGHLWYPGMDGREYHFRNLILPSITLGLTPMAIIVQLTRGAMLEVLSQDYIRTARAKGLKYRVIVLKHALKNALNPVITAVSGWLASLMAGAFFVEYIYGWKGLGSVTIAAVYNLDLPVVMGSTIFVACVFIFISILVDLLYGLVDPRVRLKG